MPLQKLPPKSQRITDIKASEGKHAFISRQKTVRTDSVLAPSYAIAQGCTKSSTRIGNHANRSESTPDAGARTFKARHRRSLPIHGCAIQRDSTRTPRSVVSPAATSKLPRSFTDSNNLKGTVHHNPRRRSMPSSFERRGRSLSPVAEGELSRHQVTRENTQRSESNQKGASRKQHESVLLRKGHLEGGWNARRERELIKREQALVEANARRERERLGILMESSPNLPPSMALPAVNAAPAKGSQRYYSQHPPSSHSAGEDTRRQIGRARNVTRSNGSIIDGRLIKNGGASKTNPTPDHVRLRRSLSAISEPRWAPYNDASSRSKSPPVISSPVAVSFIGSAPTDRHAADPRPSPKSPQTSSNSTSSSSMKSSTSGTSNTTRKPSLTYARSPDHPLRQNPVMGYQEAYPPFHEAGRSAIIPPAAPSHALFIPQRLLQVTYPQATPVSHDHARGAALQHQRASLRRRSTSTVHLRATDPDDVIYRENPDKRGLALASSRRGKGTQLREEAGEMERRAARESVRERVRRANEMEEERGKALGGEGEEGKGEKVRKGLLCGLFGRWRR